MAFEFISARQPVSVNRTNSSRGKETKRAFIESLRREVRNVYQDAPMLMGELYARIIWFHQDRPGDPDNIIKPILDALQTVVYADDGAIVKVVSERFNLFAQEIVIPETIVQPLRYAELLRLIGEQREHILFIEVGILISREIYFGPVR